MYITSIISNEYTNVYPRKKNICIHDKDSRRTLTLLNIPITTSTYIVVLEISITLQVKKTLKSGRSDLSTMEFFHT
jgi:hypothetical protein